LNLYELLSINPKEKKLINLVANGGAGKTYQLVHAYKSFLKNELKSSIIPLYVPVNQYDGVSVNYICDYVLSNYIGSIKKSVDQQSRTNLKKVFENTQNHFYLFVDSIDETSVFPDRLCTEIEILSEFKNLSIVVSSRAEIEGLKNFKKVSLDGITVSYLEKEINSYTNLNLTLRGLLNLPFYFLKYKEIEDETKQKISSAAELIDEYYKWILEKSQKSVDNMRYYEFSRFVVEEFLPEFAFALLEKQNFMIFDRLECINSWKKFREENDIIFDKSCILALEDYGIIKKYDKNKYSFSHQNIQSFMASKYLYQLFINESAEFEKQILDVNEQQILMFLGEFLGEHHYAKKKNIHDERSPIERLLSKYKGIYDGSSSEIVSKYIDIMKTSRRNECTADYSHLDLRKTRLYSKHSPNYENSNFDHCKTSWMSFEQPFLENDIELIYADEVSGCLVVSDLKTSIFFLNSKLEVTDVLDLTTETSTYDTNKKNISIDISRDLVKVCISWNENNSILHTEYKERPLSRNSCKNADVVLRIENGVLSYKNDNVITVVRKERFLKHMNGKIYGLGLKNWDIISSSATVGIDINKHQYRNTLVKHNVRHLYSELSMNGFTFDDGEFVEGDILVQGNSYGRVYDTKKRCSTIYYFHGGTNIDKRQLCSGCFISRCPLVFAYEEEHYSKIITHADISGRKIGAEILVPIVSNFLSTSVCGKYLLVYSSGEICYSDISDFELSNIEGVECTTEYLPFKNVNLDIQGEILFNGCRIINEILYIAYVNENKCLGFVMYDLLKHKIIKNLSMDIYMHDIDFKKSGQTYSGKEAACNLVIMPNYIYLRIYDYLYVISVESGWHFSVHLTEINVKNVVGIHVFESGLLLFQNDDRIIKVSFKKLIEDKDYYNEGTWGEVIAENDKYYIKKIETYDTIFKRETDGLKCIELIKECEIKYLENMNLQGCSFVDAKLTDVDGNEKPIGDDLLFNT